MYIKTEWIARVGTALNRFLKTNETTTSVELTNDPTGVTTAGTPFTVANMNKIEEGIESAHYTEFTESATLETITSEEELSSRWGKIKKLFSIVIERLGQSVNTTSNVTFNSVNTGHGSNELYAMNQNVRTTDSVTFATVNTGHGSNELYAMNQNVTTSVSPTFAGMTLNGALSPCSATQYSAFVARNSQKVLPRGVYLSGDISLKPGVEAYINGVWQVSRKSLLFSDGVNVRLTNDTDNDYTYHALKF